MVRTVRVDDPGPLLALLPDAPDATAWVRRGEGLVGWGVAAICRTTGADRFADANDLVGRARPRTPWSATRSSEPGTGLVCFGSFAFADYPGRQRAGGPRGRRRPPRRHHLADHDRRRRDRRAAAAAPGRRAPPRPGGITFADGALHGDRVGCGGRRGGRAASTPATWRRSCWPATWSPPATTTIDVRWPLRRLAASYPMCWTFHVDGLFGATPEMLVRRERGLVTSRVLAGTIRRTGDDAHDLALAATLARSSKDLEEHEYAVRSVADALAPHCSSMNVPEAPFVLHLPNVMHLATDVAGVVHDAATGRPRSSWPRRCTRRPRSAAPRPTWRPALITEIEGMDRGRYAGPVGWMDATGDGEWGIALRSAEIAGRTGAAVRRLRHRRRLRPGGRARRGAGQVRAGARLARPDELSRSTAGRTGQVGAGLGPARSGARRCPAARRQPPDDRQPGLVSSSPSWIATDRVAPTARAKSTTSDTLLHGACTGSRRRRPARRAA